MSAVLPGRYTVDVSEPFVVFLIGMRVNRFWAMNKWLPVARAMGPMIAALSQDPQKGLLGVENFGRIWPIETCMVSYWRSFDDLMQFARSQDDPHWAAWQRFMRDIGSDGSVGIWHETYQIDPASYECIYSNMPAFGLGAATAFVPVSEKTRTARTRMASAG